MNMQDEMTSYKKKKVSVSFLHKHNVNCVACQDFKNWSLFQLYLINLKKRTLFDKFVVDHIMYYSNNLLHC